MNPDNESRQEIRPNLKLLAIPLSVLAFVAAIFGVYAVIEATNKDNDIIIILGIFLLILLCMAINSTIQYWVTVKKHNNLLKELKEFEKRNVAISERFDEKKNLVEQYKNIMYAFEHLLFHSISIPSTEEKQQLQNIYAVLLKSKDNLKENEGENL